MGTIEVQEQQARVRAAVELDAAPDQVWALWADPRALEQWWGPRDYPATVTEHVLQPDGRTAYHLTSPEGDEYHGWWRTTAVQAPRRLEFEEGFAHDDGRPNHDLPVVRCAVTLTALPDGRTGLELEMTFSSEHDLERMQMMGFTGSLRESLDQLPEVLRAAR